MRLGLIIPTSIVFKIFGYSEFSYYLLPVLSMAVLVVFVFLLGEKLFNYKVGLFSALWMIFMPGMCLESGHLLPDIPATNYMLAGLILVILKKNGIQPDKPGKRIKEYFPYFLSGILFGLSYLTKEYFLFFILLVPIYFLIAKIPIRYLLVLSAGALFVALFELVIGYFVYRDPFIRFITVAPREIWYPAVKDIGEIVSYLPMLLRRKGNTFTFFLTIIFVIGSIPLIIKKNRQLLFLLLYAGLVYCFYTGLGLLPAIFHWENKVILRPHIFRYWIPIFPPLIIGGIAVIDKTLFSIFGKLKLKQKFFNVTAYGLLAVVVMLSGLWGYSFIRYNPDLVRSGSDHYIELRQFLKENNQTKCAFWVIRDIRTAYEPLIKIYTHDFWGKEIWFGRIKYLNNDRSFMHLDEIPTGGYAIVDREYYNPEFNPVPDYLGTPPDSWEMVFESENKIIALYVVN
jgi:4-amino-4-deoxy-L-arabinose transferase-like glycosyltransferase